MTELIIRQARDEDVHLVLTILDDASDRMQALGYDMWRRGLFTAQRLLPLIESGVVHLAYADGIVVGTITLQWTDALFWPDAADEAGYVHHLAVAEGFQGRRFGEAMVRWAVDECRGRQMHFVRLDTMCENPRLRRYYADLGFSDVGERRVTGLAGREFCVTLFELRL